MGWTGNPFIRTPILDKLAGKSFCFMNNFVTTSICAISRASFLTGQYAGKHGVREFEIPLSDAAMAASYPNLLKNAGYNTGFIGKWGIGHHQIEKAQFMYNFFAAFPGHGNYHSPHTPNLHLTDVQANQATGFIYNASKSDKPFFLQLSFKAPHSPYIPSSEFRSFYHSLNIPRFPTDTKELFDQVPPSIAQSRLRTRWWQFLHTDDKMQGFVKSYYRLVSGVDKAVGQIIRSLEETGQLDNTIIIFSSDNGYLIGEHGLWGKWMMYEESIRVPLMVYIPPARLKSQPQRRLIEKMTLNIDVAPTILELAGLPVPSHIQGSSMLPLMFEDHPKWRDEFYYEHFFTSGAGWIPPCIGIRTERWKYTLYNYKDEVLYDLQDDPYETRNLAYTEQYKKLAGEMKGRLGKMRMNSIRS